MGPEGGFVMHWSRLVDAPIAAIMLAVAADHRQHGVRRNRRADRLAAGAFGRGDVLPDQDRQSGRRRLGDAAGGHHRCGGTVFHRHLRARQYRPPQCATGAVARRDSGAVHAGGRASPRDRGRPMRGADAGGRHGNAALCGGRRALRRRPLPGRRPRARRAGDRLRRRVRGRRSGCLRRHRSGQRLAVGRSAMPTPFRNSRSRRSPAPASRSPPASNRCGGILRRGCSRSPASASLRPQPSCCSFRNALPLPMPRSIRA